MARIRTIKPEFPQSESMGRVSRDARLTFILLWTLADDSGRLRGSSRMLASLLFPYDDDAKRGIDKWLSELDAEGCVRRYTVDGNVYIEIPNWRSHQKIDKPSASKLPPFENSREDSRGFAEHSPNIREGSSEEWKGMEGSRPGPGEEGTGTNTKAPTAEKSLIPPSVESVRQYCLSRGNDIDPQAFVDFYESKGWLVGKAKMKDWQAAVRTWEASKQASKPKLIDRVATDEDLANWTPSGT